MTDLDIPAFNRAFNDLAELYNLTEYEDKRLQYFQALSDCSLVSLEAAFATATHRAGIGTCRFFPLPGVMRELTANVSRPYTTTPVCEHCAGTGWRDAEPNSEGQPTVRPCACRP